jgi:hypothetical protein
MAVISVFVHLSTPPRERGQPPSLVIGMCEETAEDLHHPAEQAASRRRQRCLAGYVRIVAPQPGVCGSDAGFLVSCAALLPICVPAIAGYARAVVL